MPFDRRRGGSQMMMRQAGYLGYILATRPFACWPISEKTGSQIVDVVGGFHGTNNNVTLNATTFPDGSPAPLFTGSTSRIALPAVALDAPLDPTLGALGCWLKVREPAVWGDNTSRIPFSVGADVNNRIFVNKSDSFFSPNRMSLSYRAGGTAENFTNAADYQPEGWFHALLTWNKAADLVEFWRDGVLVGTSNSLGTWTGTLATAFTAIGNFTSAGGGTTWWDGYVKYATLWNRVPEPEEIASLVPDDFLA